MKGAITAVSYLRVSTEQQTKGFGWERQAEAAQYCAERIGYEITKEFKEFVSGTKDADRRDGFNDMVNYCLDNDIKYIIVEGQDRIGRTYEVQIEAIKYLYDEFEIEIIDSRTGDSITDGFYNDPDKRFVIQLMALMAERDRNSIVKRTQDGLKRARKKAKTNGKLTRTGKGKCGGRKINLDLVRRTFELKYKSPMVKTSDQVAEQLNHEGFNPGKNITGQDVRNTLSRNKNNPEMKAIKNGSSQMAA